MSMLRPKLLVRCLVIFVVNLLGDEVWDRKSNGSVI